MHANKPRHSNQSRHAHTHIYHLKKATNLARQNAIFALSFFITCLLLGPRLSKGTCVLVHSWNNCFDRYSGPFCRDIGGFCGNVGLFHGDLGLFWRRLKALWRGIQGSFTENARLFAEDTGPCCSPKIFPLMLLVTCILVRDASARDTGLFCVRYQAFLKEIQGCFAGDTGIFCSPNIFHFVFEVWDDECLARACLF